MNRRRRTLGLVVAAALLALVVARLLGAPRWSATAPGHAPPPTTPVADRPTAAGVRRVPAPAAGPAAPAMVALSAAWGAGAGQLGRRLDPESVAEGPMSFVVDRSGIVVLDNVNRRLARFDAHGRALPAIALDSEAAQDVARGARDRLAVLDRLHDKHVTLYDDGGRVLGVLPLVGAGIVEAAAVTGIFTDRDGNLYAEREHGSWLRLGDAEGRVDPARPTVPGRPLRDGRFVAAAIADKQAGRARVQVFDAGGAKAFDTTVDFGAPLLYLALLDGDAAGSIYLGAHVGHEAPSPPYRIDDEALSLVALTADGSLRAQRVLPAPPPREESFRDLYVGDDGTIYWMRRTAAGVVVEAYRL